MDRAPVGVRDGDCFVERRVPFSLTLHHLYFLFFTLLCLFIFFWFRRKGGGRREEDEEDETDVPVLFYEADCGLYV